MNLVFMGTPSFALPSLREVIKNFGVKAIITQPDRPAGRGQKLTPPPVKLFAIENGIECLQPQSKAELYKTLESLKPDCVVVVAYGKILTKDMLSIPKFGCINLHASLLPKYRGASPIQRSLLAGDRFTGNSVMLMDEGMDTGPILSRQIVKINQEDNYQTLSEKLSKMGAFLLVETLKLWFKGEIKPKPQKGNPTYAPPITKEELRICWKAQAQSVINRVRAFFPEAYCLTPKGERLKILRAKLAEGVGEAGEIIDKKRLVVACGEGAVEILDLINQKGKRVSGEEFIRGYREGFLL
ncbi:methionyl-tRNA formyltransferase [Thermocrinis sp.]|uniref:methionyl-tRNA formyltransferase n=1 Tax=Thermocrinis sp. TaxID=2024383 RepID=UPI002FDE5A12